MSGSHPRVLTVSPKELLVLELLRHQELYGLQLVAASGGRLKRGTGWLIPPGVLHAPGSLCTYEPQWGSDVFGMYQSLVEGREVPWSLLVKDMPKPRHRDLDFIVEQLDWDENTDPNFKENHYLEPVPVADTAHESSAHVPAPIRGESPIRPHCLLLIPPVEVPAAMFPNLSSATAPTVPNF